MFSGLQSSPSSPNYHTTSTWDVHFFTIGDILHILRCLAVIQGPNHWSTVGNLSPVTLKMLKDVATCSLGGSNKTSSSSEAIVIRNNTIPKGLKMMVSQSHGPKENRTLMTSFPQGLVSKKDGTSTDTLDN